MATSDDLRAARRGGASPGRPGRGASAVTAFRSRRSREVLADVRRELLDGRGIVMMQDFPIDRFDREAHGDRLSRHR